MNTKPTLETLTTYNPLTIDVDTPLLDVVRMLDESGFHHWPVIDSNRRVQGVLSEVDLAKAIRTPCAVTAAGDVADLDWSQRTAGDVISRRVITARIDESIRSVARKLVGNRIHSLPVVDGEQLIGMVTTTDFIRDFTFGHWPNSHKPVSEYAVNSADPIDSAATFDEALERMQVDMAEYLVVAIGERPLGVVSRRQIRKAICRIAIRNIHEPVELALGTSPIAPLLANAPLARPGQRMIEAAVQMLEHQVQAIAVINQAYRLLGTVSEEEILRGILEHCD